mmetsp:Transcript_29014/g.71122  ORF Transcript_29014/g.71122 Transcript_29014/m.71122 type:complete len:435 (-) Transcript_29014:122-1426(-)
MSGGDDVEMDEATRSKLDDMIEILDRAKTLHTLKPKEAESLYRSIFTDECDGEELNKVKEQSICKLGELFADQQRVEDIQKLMVEIRPFYNTIPKAKTAKIVRTLIDLVAKVPGGQKAQLTLSLDTIEWCRSEKRTFLRHRVQCKLANMYYEAKDFTAALALVSELLKEVKKLDDKPLLVEIHLVESRTYHQIRNLARSKAALTSARTTANAIYCPPLLQASIDAQSGTLHAEEKDYKTAYSYFYEAFEAQKNADDPKAITNLKHMLLCKIMTDCADEVPLMLDGKLVLKFAGPELDVMREIAKAYQERALDKLIKAQEKYKDQLESDPVTKFHLTNLHDTLLQQNLCRLIEPFSAVQMSHVAKLIDLPVDKVESTLSQMILDQKFTGILDAGKGALIAYQDTPDNETYETGIQVIENMGKVVDSLYTRASHLS